MSAPSVGVVGAGHHWSLQQSAASPVIQLATLAREGRVLPRGRHCDSHVLSRSDGLSPDDMLAHDQVIVGTHRTRHRVNDQIRCKLGYGGATPAIGEKLVCLRNHKQKGLHNGTLWTVVGSKPPSGGFVALEVEDDARRRVEVEAPTEFRSFGSRPNFGGWRRRRIRREEAIGLAPADQAMHDARESRPNQGDQHVTLAGRPLDAGAPALVVGEHIRDRAFPSAVEEINPW